MPTVEFISHIDHVKNATKEALERAAEIIGGMAETNAKQNVTDAVYSSPNGGYVRTGNLRNSITHDETSDDHSVTVIVGSAVDYAP